MKFAIHAALFFGVMICAVPASAQNAGVVAVIDVGKVFKNHPVFKARMDAVKQTVTDYEGVINQRREALNAQKKKQDEYNSDSPEYKRIEQALAHDIADIQVQNNMKRKEILVQETRIYYETYKEINDEIGKIASQFNIALVLNYDSTLPDPDDRASVQRGVSNPVVFQRNLDLTALVIKNLQERHPNVAGAAGPQINR
ncbi:OmpH family outer membrane protein [Lignipirellula cremea]|uniref:Outer membrane protein (OmpH-like) n=1 Tax=Lignipirellula cremea TaxID=2528010 RepID=A0A518DXU6_9BACT|nr:OmpH family outer membrane protein [Lignipirellula cremea]QDU96672.1 Outer membrane protein (OmpH-like) [Lignipirellula cremea]